MTAQPSAYHWKGRCGPFDLELSEHTFPPSSLSQILGDALELEGGERVIDAGCGSGVLGIIAALLGAGEVIGVDKAPDTVAVAGANAERLGVADRMRFYQGDLFAPLPADATADLIIGDVSGVADELARVSGWFPDGRGGGPRGAELPIRLVHEAPDWLRPGGRLLLPTGTIQDERSLLAAAEEVFPAIEQRAERRFPLPQKLAEAPEVRRLMDEGVIELEQKGSRLLWYGRVWECALEPVPSRSS